MLRLHVALLLSVIGIAGCGTEPRSAGTTPVAPEVADVLADTVTLRDTSDAAAAAATPTRVQAFNVALDSLDAFVRVLEHVEGPIAAWNRAEEAARLLRYLEKNRAAFALEMSREEAMARYPEQIQRLSELEARRSAELKRIDEDGVSGRVLVQEMAKADAAAEADGP